MQQYIDILCTVSFYVKTVSMYRYVVNCKLYQYITYHDNVLWLADNQIIGLVVLQAIYHCNSTKNISMS